MEGVAGLLFLVQLLLDCRKGPRHPPLPHSAQPAIQPYSVAGFLLSLRTGQRGGRLWASAHSSAEMVCNGVALRHVESPCLESPSLSSLVLHLL